MVEFVVAGLGVAIMMRAAIVRGQRDLLKDSRGRTRRTMALDHAALLEVLDALKAGDAGERVRVAAETMYQALVEPS